MKHRYMVMFVMALLLLAACHPTGSINQQAESIEQVEDKTEFTFRIFSPAWVLRPDASKVEYFEQPITGLFVDEDAAKVTRMNIRGQTMRVTYDHSVYRSPETFCSHFYYDEKGNLFAISDEGQIIVYNYRASGGLREVVRAPETTEEYILIAKNCLDDIISLDDYEAEHVFNENSGQHEVYFKKYLDGFTCTDLAIVYIEPDGTIHKFNSGMLGKMSTDIDSPYKPAIVEEKLLAWVEDVYAEDIKRYDSVTIVDLGYYLSLDENGEYLVECKVEFEMRSKYEGYTIVSRDIIGVLVQ